MKEFTREFKELVIRPTLQRLSEEVNRPFWSEDAEDLVLATALAETGLREIEQGRGRKRGPALGHFQIEPATHTSIWEHYLSRRFWLAEAIGKVSYIENDLWHKSPERGVQAPPHELLIGNLFYGVAICRTLYWQKEGPIPSSIEGKAQYWLKHYNAGGRGSINHFIIAWDNR